MCLESFEEGVLQVLPAANGVFTQTVQPVPSWSFEFEREVFDGVKIVIAGHVNVEKEIFNPDGRIRRSVVLFDVYGFKPFWEFMIHYFISEAEGVCGASMQGYVTTQFG